MSTSINVMVDLETLSTEPTAGILSLAAVVFMWDEPVVPFYERASIRSAEDHGFSISQSTMNWWTQQSLAARAEALGGTLAIHEVLEQFELWCKSLPAPVLLWGNGADFDNVILRNAFDQFGMATPWQFRANRCYRTLKCLYPEITSTFVGEKHNALADAMYQADHAGKILMRIETHKELAVQA